MLDPLPQILNHPPNTIFMLISKMSTLSFLFTVFRKIFAQKVSAKVKFIHEEVYDMIALAQSDFQCNSLQE